MGLLSPLHFSLTEIDVLENFVVFVGIVCKKILFFVFVVKLFNKLFALQIIVLSKLKQKTFHFLLMVSNF